MTTRNDIQHKEDVHRFIRSFYEALLQQPEMRHIFLEVAELDLEAHLPRIAAFWEQVLFHSGTYTGNPMLVHIELHRKYPLRPELFDQWLDTFERVGHSLFEGPRLELAIARARSIAQLMQLKIRQADELKRL